MSDDEHLNGRRHQISTLKDFGVVDVGDFIADEKILRIYSRNTKHLIYERTSGVAHAAIGVSSQQSMYLARLDRLMIQASRKFKGVHRVVLNSYKCSTLNVIFNIDDEATIDSTFSHFEKFVAETCAVKNIVEQRDNYVVWIGEQGVEHWIKSVSEVSSEVISKFYKVKALGSIVIPKSKLKKFYSKLASCLVVGLSKGVNCEEDVFAPATKYIDKCVADAARFKLVVVVFIFSMLVLFLAAGVRLYYFGTNGINLSALLIGIFGGALGAMISVLQRAKNLKVELYESIEFILLQGGVRISLGCAFGVIALVASKSGLLLELLSQNDNKMFLLSVIAGFSERLIPDFIGKIAEDGVK